MKRYKEDVRPLLLPTEPDDSDKNHIEKCLWNAIESWLKNGQKAISALNILRRRVEKSYYHSRMARFGGIIFVILSTILMSVGFGLSLSFPGSTQYDESIWEYIAGSVLIVLGTITICGAEIGYAVIAMITLNNADVVQQIDREIIDMINQLKVRYRNLSDHEDDACSAFQCITNAQKVIKKTSCNCLLIKPLARAIMFCCFQLFASIAAITLSTLISVLAFAPSNSIQSASGPVQFEIIVQAISTGAIVYNAILILIDLPMMIKSSCDIFQYKSKGVSNSTAASIITRLITELEEQNGQIMKSFEKR